MAFVGDIRKYEIIKEIIFNQIMDENIRRILVVGCGKGYEAMYLKEALNVEVVGIDIDPSFDKTVKKHVDLQICDATCLFFKDNSFDFLYSYHVLEHIRNYKKALKEMKRVLSDDGGFFIGVPNRNRFIGYISSEVPLSKKIKWNAIDLKAKIQGKFKNEFGAHAGFSLKEIRATLLDVFREVKDITNEYYLLLHKQQKNTINLFDKTGLKKYLYPSLYFIGRK